MAGIPISALRRALAEMADMSGSASFRRSIPEAMNNTVRASLGGASLGAGGGLLANMPDEESGETLDQYGGRLMRGIGTGAAIGAGLGAGAIGVAGARGLRAALAEAAAERGLGRAASREASHMDDAARFHGVDPRAEAGRMHRQFGGLGGDEIDDMSGGAIYRNLPSLPPGGRLDPKARQAMERIASELGGLGPQDLAALDDEALVRVVRQFGGDGESII